MGPLTPQEREPRGTRRRAWLLTAGALDIGPRILLNRRRRTPRTLDRTGILGGGGRRKRLDSSQHSRQSTATYP